MNSRTSAGGKTYVGARQAGVMLGLSPITVYRMAATGEIPSEVTEPDKRLLFNVDEIAKLRRPAAEPEKDTE